MIEVSNKEHKRVSNREFLNGIFGESYILSHVTDFPYNPNAIPKERHLAAWAGDYFSRYHFEQNTNQYFTISLFNCDEEQKARRRKALFKQTPCIVLDDVKEKLPMEEVQKLPEPSWVLETSVGSEQWGYIFDTPCEDRNRVENLLDGLVANGLAPKGKDPGMKGVTRYVRLPEGVNNKASKLVNGQPFKCRLLVWEPERKTTIEALAAPFHVDLDAVRREARIDGAVSISDHPVINIPEIIHIKEERSAGRFDITCPWVNEHTDADDSGSAVFTNSDGAMGFKCHHGICESRTGADLLEKIELLDTGFKLRLRHWQVVRAFANVKAAETEPALPTKSSPLDLLRSTVANGGSQKMKSQMMADKFVLKDLAILGQWTVFYAGPNTGKTLLVQWLLKEAIETGDIDGSKIFYANCDDSYKGAIEKLEIAEQFGYQMLLPNVKDFKTNSLVETMSLLAKSNEAMGVIIITDTLKKFTDLMDKKISSTFGNVAREFVSGGGTLICLAHVNKHKGADGNSIYAGTADIRDDADCVCMIEHLGSTKSFDAGEVHTVEFVSSKSRGDVIQSIAFQYTKKKGTGYRALFDSVERVDNSIAEGAKNVFSAIEKQTADRKIIEAIKTALTNGCNGQGKIIEFCTSTSDVVSHRGVKRALEEYGGCLWNVRKGDNNAFIYTLIEAPLLEKSFY
jgi:hypothetical protein